MRISKIIIYFVLLIIPLFHNLQTAISSEADGSIALALRRIQKNPESAAAYYFLGDAYVRKGRETGEMNYFNLSEQALRKSLSINSKQSGVYSHLAYVLYLKHEFNGSATEAQRAIELDHQNGDAYAVLGDSYLETGRYKEAEETYRKMLDIKKDFSAYSRISGLKSLKGDTGNAVKYMKLAVQSGITSGQPSESIAWAEWQLGVEYFAAGRLKEAEAQFNAALKTYPDYYRALSGLAMVNAGRGKYEEAVKYYKKAIDIVPLPENAAILGDIYKKTGRAKEAEEQYELVEFIGILNSLNKIIYNRELAYFYADHDLKPEKALELAEKEIEIRKDIYGYDVLAWALYKNGKTAEAHTAIKEALKMGTKDARLFYHAGMIYKKLNDQANARKYLTLAVKTNPYFHPLHAETAINTIKMMGEKAAFNEKTK